MRLLLDADLPQPRIGAQLERKGHNVSSLQADAARRSLPDQLVLEWAATEGRILVTRNARHFEPLARAWAEEQREHAGPILIWTLQSNAFRDIGTQVDRLLAGRPDSDHWRSLVLSV